MSSKPSDLITEREKAIKASSMVLNEYFTTEENFSRDMKLLVEFGNACEARGINLPKPFKDLLKQVVLIQNSPLHRPPEIPGELPEAKLKRQVEMLSTVYTSGPFKKYVNDISNLTRLENVYSITVVDPAQRAQLDAVVREFLPAANQNAGQLGLSDLLIKPFQRVTKYPLLNRELMKQASDDSIADLGLKQTLTPVIEESTKFTAALNIRQDVDLIKQLTDGTNVVLKNTQMIMSVHNKEPKKLDNYLSAAARLGSTQIKALYNQNLDNPEKARVILSVIALNGSQDKNNKSGHQDPIKDADRVQASLLLAQSILGDSSISPARRNKYASRLLVGAKKICDDPQNKEAFIKNGLADQVEQAQTQHKKKSWAERYIFTKDSKGQSLPEFPRVPESGAQPKGPNQSEQITPAAKVATALVSPTNQSQHAPVSVPKPLTTLDKLKQVHQAISKDIADHEALISQVKGKIKTCEDRIAKIEQMFEKYLAHPHKYRSIGEQLENLQHEVHQLENKVTQLNITIDGFQDIIDHKKTERNSVADRIGKESSASATKAQGYTHKTASDFKKSIESDKQKSKRSEVEPTPDLDQTKGSKPR